MSHGETIAIPNTIFDEAVHLVHAHGLRKFIRSLETGLIDFHLDLANQNKTEAGRLLGINRTTLVMKLKAHDDRIVPEES